jgi:hypothetical protein
MSYNIITPIDSEIYGLLQQIAKDTIADLRAIPSSTKNSLVALRGGEAVNDGGGGFWTWKTGTATADEPLIVLPNDYLTAGSNQGYWTKLA